MGLAEHLMPVMIMTHDAMMLMMLQLLQGNCYGLLLAALVWRVTRPMAAEGGVLPRRLLPPGPPSAASWPDSSSGGVTSSSQNAQGGFRVWGFGFRVWLRVKGYGFRVSGIVGRALKYSP